MCVCVCVLVLVCVCVCVCGCVCVCACVRVCACLYDIASCSTGVACIPPSSPSSPASRAATSVCPLTPADEHMRAGEGAGDSLHPSYASFLIVSFSAAVMASIRVQQRGTISSSSSSNKLWDARQRSATPHGGGPLCTFRREAAGVVAH
eukprot:GHVU01148271.1.p2 GENE.GHVU01148271.1~~GHVU01148271.1.p2  ORF type:complete len:149 (-),score=17.01 GHVU01148271.1:1516-1962(-)